MKTHVRNLVTLSLDRSFQLQIMRFLFVGFTGAGCDYVVFHFLMHFGWASWLAKGLGYLSGTVVCFFLHRAFTFRVQHRSHAQTVRFFVLYGANMVFNMLCSEAVLHIAGAKQTSWAFLVASALSTAVSFVGQKVWVFQTPKDIILPSEVAEVSEANI